MGAVPSADIMDVSVEKLFMLRHFCFRVRISSQTISAVKGEGVGGSYIGN